MFQVLKNLFKDEKGIVVADAMIVLAAVIAGSVIVGGVYYAAVHGASNTINNNLNNAVTTNW